MIERLISMVCDETIEILLRKVMKHKKGNTIQNITEAVSHFIQYSFIYCDPFIYIL